MISDDLVSRLRRAVTWQGVVPHGNGLAREAAAEIERLRDQHGTYAEMVEQLTRQLDAAAVLLRRPGRVEWGYDADREAMAYFLDGEYAGATLLDLIRAAAEKGA